MTTLRRFLEGKTVHATGPLRPVAIATLERLAAGWRDLGEDRSTWRTRPLELSIGCRRDEPLALRDTMRAIVRAQQATGAWDGRADTWEGKALLRLDDAWLDLHAGGGEVGRAVRGDREVDTHAVTLLDPRVTGFWSPLPPPDGRTIEVAGEGRAWKRRLAIACGTASWERGLAALDDLMALEGRTGYDLWFDERPLPEIVVLGGRDVQASNRERAAADHFGAVALASTIEAGRAVTVRLREASAATLRAARAASVGNGTAAARLRAWLRGERAEPTLVDAFDGR